jgi:putative phage-type endonuclease
VKVVSLEQNSPEWVVWRKGGIGASDAAAVVGLSPWTTRSQLLREKRSPLTGTGDYENGAMRRGKKLEPHARRMYEELLGWPSPPACVLDGEREYMRASLDGWSPEVGIPLEIKCPNRDDHRLALRGKVPLKYVAQVHHQLWITQAKELHYVSYNDYQPRKEQFALVRVRADGELQRLLVAAEDEFWQEVKGAG